MDVHMGAYQTFPLLPISENSIEGQDEGVSTTLGTKQSSVPLQDDSLVSSLVCHRALNIKYTCKAVLQV